MTPARTLVPVILLISLAVGSLPAEASDSEKDVAALRAADEAWSKSALAGDLNAFLGMTDEAVSMLSPHAPLLAGQEAMKAWATAVMENPGYSLSWTPAQVHVAEAGDLGYTIGTYELTLHDPEGNPMEDRGKYMTVWKKQADGSWKVLADMFNTDLPPGS